MKIDTGDGVHVFIEINNGIIDNVRVTAVESEADIWESDWIHDHGYVDLEEYLYDVNNGHISHTMHTHVTKLE